MITTKSGRKNKGVGIEYNGGVQWSTILRLPEFQNEFGMGWNGNHTELENGSWGPRFDGSMQLWGNVYNNSQKLKPYVAMPDNIKDFLMPGSGIAIAFHLMEQQTKVIIMFLSLKLATMV